MQVTVGNQLRIENPSEQLLAWCKKQLILPNPEYAKKVRMHFWVGNTPEKLYLFQWDGDTLVLPYGCLNDVLAMDDCHMKVNLPTPIEVDFGCSIPLYDYQVEAKEALITAYYGILQAPAGCGKTQIGIAVAADTGRRTLWLTHTRDLLVQSKSRAEQYMSPSLTGTITEGRVQIGKAITFATVQTMCNLDLSQYRDVWDCIIVDECHLVNPIEGMYKDFFDAVKCKVLGLTATPYRLSSSRDFGSMLKFITRTKPHVFSEVIYHVQVSTLLDMGYLSKVNYYPMNPTGWNELNFKINTTGADYTDKSVQKEYERIDFYSYIVHIVQRLMNPKAGGKRKGILVFTRFLKEAERLTMSISGCVIVSGDTPKKERERILEMFKVGEIPVVANVGVLTTGFDYPELDTVVMARPTMSLAMYYQIVGRCIRPHKDKEAAWFVDLCGNINRFGEVSDLHLKDTGNGKWAVFSRGRQLTNVRF